MYLNLSTVQATVHKSIVIQSNHKGIVVHPMVYRTVEWACTSIYTHYDAQEHSSV